MNKSQNLSFTNRWMFNRVVCQEDICRELIQVLLGIEVERVEYLNAEQPYEPSAGSRGVRMDVVAKGDGRLYDIEMQVGLKPHLGRRMRYYQAAMDVGELGCGDAWGQLPESHIIFICSGDFLGGGLPVYSFDRMCREAPGLDIDEGSHWHVLNAAAWEYASDERVAEVLHYVQCGAVTGELAERIDKLVAAFNDDRNWVGRIMLWEEEIRYQCRVAEEQGVERGFDLGFEQGIEQGQKRFAALVQCLIEADRVGDIQQAVENRSYCDRLFEEFSV